jgi:ATP-dependent DNA helicase RecG
VERAGQGTDRIYEECLKQGKPLPDFTHTDAYQVSLTLRGDVADDGFLQFLQCLKEEDIDATSTQDLLVLDRVRRRHRVPKHLRPWLRRLLELGVLQSTGSGRATTYSFSSRLLDASGSVRVGERTVQQDRARSKEFLLAHITENGKVGTRFDELRRVVLPELSRDQIQTLLRELKSQGAIVAEGTTRGSKWYPGEVKTHLNANDPDGMSGESKA